MTFLGARASILGTRVATARGSLPFVLLWLLMMAILLLKEPIQLRVFSSLQPVGSVGGDRSASLFGARGEYESFQIAILPRGDDLKLLGVESSDLSERNGHTIPKSHITIYREHLVHVVGPLVPENGPNRSRGPGWYPDPLIPFSAPGSDKLRAAPIDLKADEIQGLWVDVFVPRNTPAGSYHGTIDVTTNRDTASVPLSLTVWDFELPLRPSLKTSFASWTPQSTNSVEELLRHKLMPLRLASDPLSVEDSQSLRRMEQDLVSRLGLSTLDASFWSGADQAHCAMRQAPSVQEIRAAVARHSADIALYNYTADEIVNCGNLDAPLKKWARNLHSAGLKNLVVMPPTRELLNDGTASGRSAVDIWVILPKLFDSAAHQIKEALKKGDEIWSYSALVQDSYSPKWLIDYDPINLRIHAGFLSQSLQLTGLLYWRIDRWSADPWNDVNNVGAFSSANFPGEGLLVYPGDAVGLPGIVPSIRLKLLREGIEDYEYVEILKRHGKADMALAAARRVAPNWRDWSQDPAVLEATRRQLGEELQRLSGSTPLKSISKGETCHGC